MLTIIVNIIQKIKEAKAWLDGYTLVDRVNIKFNAIEWNYIINGEDII